MTIFYPHSKNIKDLIRKSLTTYSLPLEKIVDIYWRLSHRVSRSEAEKINRPIFTITLVLADRHGTEKERDIRM
eukprot:UN02896